MCLAVDFNNNRVHMVIMFAGYHVIAISRFLINALAYFYFLILAQNAPDARQLKHVRKQLPWKFCHALVYCHAILMCPSCIGSQWFLCVLRSLCILYIHFTFRCPYLERFILSWWGSPMYTLSVCALLMFFFPTGYMQGIYINISSCIFRRDQSTWGVCF